MKRIVITAAALVAILVAFVAGWLLAVIGAGRAADPETLSDRERAFAERMRDVVLVGHFTLEGSERRDGNPERYEISGVTKLDGDRWRFNARVQYMNVDVTTPVVVPVVWAGDTPMVSISNVSLPGTYNAHLRAGSGPHVSIPSEFSIWGLDHTLGNERIAFSDYRLIHTGYSDHRAQLVRFEILPTADALTALRR